MEKRKSFYLGWLILGVVELFACGSGAGSTATSNGLLSQEPPVEAVPSGASNSPIRMSRAFFEKSISAEIHLTDPQTGADLISINPIAVTWRQDPTALAPPQPGAIADFRDFQGCLEFSGQAQGLQLCFNVMPDVSSVGANSKEMKIQGLSHLDSGIAGNSQFLSSERLDTTNTAYRIHYRVDSQQGPADLSLTLRSI